MEDTALATNGRENKKKLEVTPRQLAHARQLLLEERLKEAAAVITDGRSIKPSRQVVAGLFGVSVGGIDKTLNRSRRRRPRIAPETLEVLQDLWQEVFYLGEIKYQSEYFAREHLIAFERYLAKWLNEHADVLQHLAAIGPAPALHATAVNALWVLVEAIVANYVE